MIFTGRWCSRRVWGVHRGSVVSTAGGSVACWWCVVNMMSSERQVTYFGSDTNL